MALLTVPLAILLITAVAGASMALFGAFAGLDNVKEIGGIFAGLGALGFFALLLSPLGQVLSGAGSLVSRGSSKATQMKGASAVLDASGKKEDK